MRHGTRPRSDGGRHTVKDRVAQGFATEYGREPEVVTRAPGRLEILGNHTDYNEGVVLSVAVDRNTWVAAAPAPGRDCRLKDLRAEMGDAFDRMEALGIDFQRPGGESPRQVQARLRPLLAELADRRRPTVAVTHRGIIRALYAQAVGWDMKDDPPQALLDDCAHVFALEDDGGLHIERLNVNLREP